MWVKKKFDGGEITWATRNYPTRTARLTTNLLRTVKAEGAPINRGVEFANLLPADTLALTPQQFKTTVKKLLLEQPCYSIGEVRALLPTLHLVPTTNL